MYAEDPENGFLPSSGEDPSVLVESSVYGKLHSDSQTDCSIDIWK